MTKPLDEFLKQPKIGKNRPGIFLARIERINTNSKWKPHPHSRWNYVGKNFRDPGKKVYMIVAVHMRGTKTFLSEQVPLRLEFHPNFSKINSTVGHAGEQFELIEKFSFGTGERFNPAGQRPAGGQIKMQTGAQ